MNFGELPPELPPEIKERAEKFHNNVVDPMLRRTLAKFFKANGTDLAKMREMIESEDLSETVNFLDKEFTGQEMLEARDKIYSLMYGTIINFCALEAANLITSLLRGETISSFDAETGEIATEKMEPLSKETLEKLGLAIEGEEWKKKSKPEPESKRSRFDPNNN